jgi:putative ABC transport system permease protein
MFRNFITSAFRNFQRNKSFSLINIVGLAIGISASLIIFLIVRYDFSFEKFQPGRERIYRIGGVYEYEGNITYNSGSPIPLANSVGSEISEIEVASFCQTRIGQRISVQRPGKQKPTVFKKDNKVIYADKNYFSIIPYEWINGSPQTALEQPYQAVLTKSKAEVLFPGIPLAEIPGHEFFLSDSIRTTITGIVKDIEENTDFSFNVFVSRKTFEIKFINSYDWTAWDNVSSETQVFLKLRDGVAANDVQNKINALYQSHRKPNPEDRSTSKFILQPLADMHFNSNYSMFDQRIAHKTTLYGLMAIASFLLLLGCINFINLTTAQASQRAKEIGIRKTIGSSKNQLVMQFLSETFLLTLTATLLSVFITPLLLKAFADFIPEGLHLEFFHPQIWLFLFSLTVVISMLSGFYPAMVLASYKPVSVLKNQIVKTAGSRSVRLRKVLSISQFVIAQVFIIITVLVSKQIRYTLNKDLGFKKDAIIFFQPNPESFATNSNSVLLEKIKALPEVQNASLSFGPPSYSGEWTTTAKMKDAKSENSIMVSVKLGDPDYINLYNIKLLAGRNLAQSDTINGLLINESTMHEVGIKYPADAIGKILEWNQMFTPIVGVVADFHDKSLHKPISPLLLTHWATHEGVISIALPPNDPENHTWKTAMDKIGKIWKEIYPDDDIEFEFFDQSLAKYYEADKNISKLLMWSSGLSIFISCLGLLGLIIYITNQRTKEIGIRKVIGASVVQIISLLSKDFLKLLLIAFLIAVPISWYSSNKWLENFAYRTEIAWWIFLAGGLIMVIMAMLVLVLRTVRVATANPVNSLRTE